MAPKQALQPNLRFSEEVFDFGNLFTEPPPEPYYRTNLGALWAADCVDLLRLMKDETIDTVFADPPFNIGKTYRSSTNDSLPEDAYLDWCRDWIEQCVRTLKPGGSIFIYNLPKWNIPIGSYLLDLGLEFRHWIAIQMSASLPIRGRLHPSHYSLLYYSKGRPRTFHRIRTPIELCRHCNKEIKDYGGHRKALNPRGLTLKDVWADIPPVRHQKFKSKRRAANALSTKILDRVVEMSTVPGDIVMDPFGGSGTTYAVCQRKERRWIGIEVDYCDDIAERLEHDHIAHHKNDDFVEST